MKPLIGIIMRDDISKMGHKILVAYNDMVLSIFRSGGIPIMVPNDNIKDYLKLCAGFILQGGDNISENNLNNLKILRDRNIPTLGICLGMQEMGVLCGGELIDILGHIGNKNHLVNVTSNGLLYRILGEKKILVNSRHKSAIVSPKIHIEAISDDGIIEAVSDDNLKFFLGLEWHPENMYTIDNNAKKIFDYFVKMCDDKACK